MIDDMEGALFDAWAAGFIDGEGCIAIKVNRVKLAHYYYVCVIVGQSASEQPSVLHDLQVAYGGNIGRNGSAARLAADHRQQKWNWQVTGLNAHACLLRVRPYLRWKSDQADLAIAFRTVVGKPGGRRTALDLEAQVDLYRRLRACKNYSQTRRVR